MSPEELDSLVNDIEENLKRDLVLVKGFHSEGLQDDRRGKKVFAVKMLCFFNTIRFFILSLLCLFPSSQTSIDLRIIFIDTFFAFGSFGCLSNQILLLGFTFLQNFLHVMHEAEKNNQLEIISHIRDHRKFKLTSVERIKFAKYLKWIKALRSVFIYVTLPSILSFVGVGTCLSSLELESRTFTAASIFVALINCTHLYFAAVWSHYAYIMPIHSNNVLLIQLNRLFERMNNLQKAQNFIDGNLESETKEQELSIKIQQWAKRTQQAKERQSILKMTENVLRQIDEHNETVKHILDKGINYLVPAYGLAIVFFANERGDLLRHTFSAAAGSAALIFYASLLKTHDVYTLSLRLSSNLHGMQVQARGRRMKNQLQILRLIERTSDCESWHHSIGFTVGNRGSLSSKLVLSSFFQTMTIALTFLNARSAWRQ